MVEACFLSKIASALLPTPSFPFWMVMQHPVELKWLTTAVAIHGFPRPPSFWRSSDLFPTLLLPGFFNIGSGPTFSPLLLVHRPQSDRRVFV